MNLPLKALFPAVGACLLLTAASCKKDDNPLARGYTVLNGVSYGSAPAQVMDIYLPPNNPDTLSPAILLIHGGAWVSGDKSEFNDAIPVLQKLLGRFAIININYRLLGLDGSNAWPAQLDDIDAAINFIAREGAKYRIEPGLLVIVGASAGAHLGLLKAYTRNTYGRVRAVVDLFGPVDMIDLYQDPPDPTLPSVLHFFLNGSPTSRPQAYESASPLYQVTPQAPPTLIFHGGKDALVRVEQSDRLHKRLQAAGVPTELIIYPNEGHGWTGANLMDTYTRAAKFIQSQLY